MIVSLLGRGGWGGADGTGLQQQQRDQKHHHLILDSQQSETGASSVGLTQGLMVVVVVGWPPQLLQHTPKEEEPNSWSLFFEEERVCVHVEAISACQGGRLNTCTHW